MGETGCDIWGKGGLSCLVRGVALRLCDKDERRRGGVERIPSPYGAHNIRAIGVGATLRAANAAAIVPRNQRWSGLNETPTDPPLAELRE